MRHNGVSRAAAKLGLRSFLSFISLSLVFSASELISVELLE